MTATKPKPKPPRKQSAATAKKVAIASGPTTVLHLRLPNEVTSALKDMADADRRNMSEYVRLVLVDHVEQASRPKRSATKKAGK